MKNVREDKLIITKMEIGGSREILSRVSQWVSLYSIIRMAAFRKFISIAERDAFEEKLFLEDYLKFYEDQF
jgi:hypothetical protein